jgi:hypothetical protein
MAIWSCQFGNVNWRWSKSTGRFSILAMWTWQARNVHPLGKITKSNNQLDNGTWAFVYWILTRASPPTLSIWPSKHVSHIQVLVTNFFSNPTHKTETRWETANSKPLGPIKLSNPSETRSSQ